MNEIIDLTLGLLQGIITILIESPFMYLMVMAMLLTIMTVIYKSIYMYGGGK